MRYGAAGVTGNGRGPRNFASPKQAISECSLKPGEFNLHDPGSAGDDNSGVQHRMRIPQPHRCAIKPRSISSAIHSFVQHRNPPHFYRKHAAALHPPPARLRGASTRPLFVSLVAMIQPADPRRPLHQARCQRRSPGRVCIHPQMEPHLPQLPRHGRLLHRHPLQRPGSPRRRPQHRRPQGRCRLHGTVTPPQHKSIN